MIEEDSPKRKISHEIGQDLSNLSIEELSGRMELMKAEILRLETARSAKQAQLQAAQSMFKIV